MEAGKSVAFTGHRPKSLPWGYNEKAVGCTLVKDRLRSEIVKAIEDGYTNFISGVAMGIDLISARIVLELKDKYPYITLECIIPYEEQASRWSVEQREIYFNVLEKSDKTHTISNHYNSDVYKQRNMYLVQHADLIIAVCSNEKSGTSQTINFAKQNNKSIILIDPTSLT